MAVSLRLANQGRLAVKAFASSAPSISCSGAGRDPVGEKMAQV
jgi:hypothetical protein